MWIYILMILACVPLYVINSFCDKYASLEEGDKHGILYNCIKFFICTFFLFAICVLREELRFEAGALFCGIVCGIMYAVSKTIILKGYAKSSVAFMTLCHAAGMIIPCIIGHFFWNEPLDLLSTCAILMVVFSISLLKEGNTQQNGFGIQGVLIGIIVALTSGGVMITQKVMGIHFVGESVSAYNLYAFLTAFLILCFGIRRKNKIKMKKTIVVPAVFSAVSLCVISLVMTEFAKNIPSIILFPLFNGAGIIFVCLTATFAFKERLTVKKIIGLILGVLGLFLTNL